MCRRRCILGLALLILFGVAPANLGASGSGDFDGNGYLDQSDYFIFAICFSLSGPSEYPGFQECVEVFDRDADGDVDLADYAGFSMSLGHLPMPLKDRLGRPITIDSTEPYSPNRTCGECHEHFVEAISNGEWFQQGRTDLDGNVDMRDDYEGDGRYWIKSAGRYGKWGQSFQFMLAAKENAHPSQIDQTAFAWVRDCSGCHSGGGPGEFDRDDQLFYNEATGAFGYEASGKTSEDVVLDGDYTVLNWSTGSLDPAPWDVTGVSEPDCLLCHRDRRPTVDGVDMVRAWRASTLAAGANLVDSQGKPVPAFAAASTAGQGWFAGASSAATNAGTKGKGQLPLADRAFLDEPHLDRSNVASEPTLQIDYSVGVADGSLVVNEKNEVLLTRDAVAQRTLDRACVDCHPLAVVAGEVWFDDRDIHYRKFNNLNDEDPNNDIPPDRSTVCTECHPTGLDHNAAKGNSFQLQYRNELDYVNFRTCRDCHLTHLPNGEPNPLKHPESIDVPGDTPIHQIGFAEGENGPMRVMSCQACHIPYALTPGLFFRDITIPGNLAWTSQYLSSDPLNPGDSDKTRWYPPLLWKTDTDGVRRLFPASVWINIYFGDWDQKGTPDDLSDDVIAPIYTWRVAQAVGTTALPIVTDDDGDGRLEIDRPEEIVVYLKALRQNDVHGEPVARNPVLVRGPRVWYFDPQTETGVNHYYHEDKGIPMTSYPYIWGMDHNVRPAEEAWGAGDEPEACNTCHRNDGKSPVFDRKVLVDPHGLDGKPEYTTVKEMVKVYPFHSRIILKDYLGEPLTLDSTRPYSGRQTCGGVRCHDIDLISNGLVFQEGRTDPEGNIVMHDDFFGDQRWWVRSAGMYGRWSGGGGGLNRQTAGKTNASASEIDMTTFYWSSFCGGCHAGGGGMEFDRDGMRLWDEETGLFGYEQLGLGPDDVTLDGDYAFVDITDGSLQPARWDITGVADPECLHCHRAKRTYVDLQDMHREWRAAVLGTTTRLVDASGSPVQAYASAGTAGQGWFSTLDVEADPPVLQIDYRVGVDAGDLSTGPLGELILAGDFLARPPRDEACWGCHLPGGFQNKRGTVWFDERGVHFKKFTNRNDDKPTNDIPDHLATVCNECHPNDVNHNFAKGDSPYAQFRNEIDWVDFRSCRECHLEIMPNGDPNPFKHPDSPGVPGDVEVHRHGFVVGENGPMNRVSCQGCHVQHALKRAIIVTDRSLTGSDMFYFTDEFLSADPIDPTDPDKSTWYPELRMKVDTDGVERLFPQKRELAIYWADWDKMDTPDDLSDDTIQPVILWRVQQITGGAPLPGVTDDNGDGKLEVNRPAEMLIYMNALKGNDLYGQPVARNPVLVKGPDVWFEDPDAAEGVGHFAYEGTGIYVEGYETFGLDHNVLESKQSWGYDPVQDAYGCRDCHDRTDFHSPVFDRKILIDPWDETGEPVYQTIRAMTGLNPP